MARHYTKAAKNLSALIENVARVYATDPHYAAKVKDIAAVPEVAAAIAQERKSSSRENPGIGNPLP